MLSVVGILAWLLARLGYLHKVFLRNFACSRSFPKWKLTQDSEISYFWKSMLDKDLFTGPELIVWWFVFIVSPILSVQRYVCLRSDLSLDESTRWWIKIHDRNSASNRSVAGWKSAEPSRLSTGFLPQVPSVLQVNYSPFSIKWDFLKL